MAEQTRDESWLATSDTYMRTARAAGRGTIWLSHLAAPADTVRRSAPSDEVDAMDLSAANAVHESFQQTARARDFDSTVVTLRQDLAATDPGAYERALVLLGTFAGARESVGNRGSDAAPDAGWLFDDVVWVCWEAKSDARPEGELGATDVRQAGAHLRFIASEKSSSAPGGSVSIVVTPQTRVHPAARRVAEAHVYLVTPEAVLDLCERLIRAWRVLRTRGTQAPTVDDILTAFEMEGCSPSQWLPLLTSRQIQAGDA